MKVIPRKSNSPNFRKVKILALFNHKPEFIRLQFKSIQRNILDRDYEYIVVNNARIPGVRMLLQSITRSEKTPFQVLAEAIQTRLRRNQINRIARELGVEVIRVRENKDHDSKSRFPSRIVAYTLNWLFSEKLSSNKSDEIVCLIDSDMFFISPISISEALCGNSLGIIPQYRGLEARYLWTGFAIFDLAKLTNPRGLNFGLGIIDGVRCDVGGMTHYYLKEFSPSEIEFEFINIVASHRVEDRVLVEVNINGNVRLDLEYDESLSNAEVVIKEQHSKLALVTGKDAGEILKNYEFAIARLVKLCEKFELNPKNVDFIRTKHRNAEEFFVLHYKNGSNPRNFEDRQYFDTKFRWCEAVVQGVMPL